MNAFRSTLLACCASLALFAGEAIAQIRYARVSVGFYNLENLFDTEDGPNNDADFLPTGSNAWTQERYTQKLERMAEALSQIAGGKAPDILGVCELENRHVLEDLIAHPKLAGYGYQIAHFDSPDKRGIDCALLYRPEVLTLQGAQPHMVSIPDEPHIYTRDILEVNGLVLGEPCSFLVGHWPSRAGGEQISLKRRDAAARVMRNVVDSLSGLHRDERIVLMGDFNDDPTSPSVLETLGAQTELRERGDGKLFNVMAKLHRSGYGTLAYRDVWNLFDNIVVTTNLMGNDYSRLQVVEDKQTKAYGRINNAEFLTQQTGQYKGYPLRTFSRGQFQNGYSDHYPVYIYLAKRIKR